MSDFNSSLPVRTENNGDVVAKLVDFTTNTQGLAIDASGLVGAKLFDGAGTAVTSQANGGQRALDVGINVAGVQIDPRQVRALTNADVVTVEQGTNPWTVAGTVTANQGGSWTVAATQSGSWTVAVSNLPTTVDTDYGAVGASTIRTAAQVGNATGAADFNNGATGAQTLRVAANLAVAGADVSNSNPVPVVMASNPPIGDHKDDFKVAAAVAGGASDNHDYTVTAGKTLQLMQVEASASGKAKMEIQVETGVATGTFVTKFVQFNSTADTNMSIVLADPILVAAGVRVRVVMSNRDNQAQDLYSTICGTEV